MDKITVTQLIWGLFGQTLCDQACIRPRPLLIAQIGPKITTIIILKINLTHRFACINQIRAVLWTEMPELSLSAAAAAVAATTPPANASWSRSMDTAQETDRPWWQHQLPAKSWLGRGAHIAVQSGSSAQRETQFGASTTYLQSVTTSEGLIYWLAACVSTSCGTVVKQTEKFPHGTETDKKTSVNRH